MHISIRSEYELSQKTGVTIKSKTGETLWEHLQKMVYTPQNSNSGNPLADLIIMAVSAAKYDKVFLTGIDIHLPVDFIGRFGTFTIIFLH